MLCVIAAVRRPPFTGWPGSRAPSNSPGYSTDLLARRSADALSVLQGAGSPNGLQDGESTATHSLPLRLYGVLYVCFCA